MAEIDRNRDFYGDARFDDTQFQLSGAGQTLQRKFVEVYAEQVRDNIEDKLTLPAAPGLTSPSIRQKARIGTQVNPVAPQPGSLSLHDEVQQVQRAGKQRIDGQRDLLDNITRHANSASADAARTARTRRGSTSE